MQTPEYTWPSRVGSPLSPALQPQVSADSIGNEASSPPSEKSPSEVILLDLTGCKKSTTLVSSSSLELSAVSPYDAVGESGSSTTVIELKALQVTANADPTIEINAITTNIPLTSAISHKQEEIKEDCIQVSVHLFQI